MRNLLPVAGCFRNGRHSRLKYRVLPSVYKSWPHSEKPHFLSVAHLAFP